MQSRKKNCYPTSDRKGYYRSINHPQASMRRLSKDILRMI